MLSISSVKWKALNRMIKNISFYVHWKCMILTCLIYSNVTIVAWCKLTPDRTELTKLHGVMVRLNHSPCDDGYFYIPLSFGVVIYVLYIVESWHSKMHRDLRNKLTYKDAYEYIEKMKQAFPIVWWRVLCYHYTRRSCQWHGRQVTSYRNGDTYTTTQDYYERVNTNTALAAFDFSTCGVTDTTKPIGPIDRHPIALIKFTKSFGFAQVEAENDYLSQRSRFFEENELKDDYIETHEGMNLTDVDFCPTLVVFQESSYIPWYISHFMFWILTILSLSWPYRVLLSVKTVRITVGIEKVFGAANDSANEREAAGGNQEPHEECEILPSYSEVMLSDSIIARNSTKSHQVSRAVSAQSFSHITDSTANQLTACVHIDDQFRQITFQNTELPNNYQSNKLYRTKCETISSGMANQRSSVGKKISQTFKTFVPRSKTCTNDLMKLNEDEPLSEV